ncbi:extracellular solute-binding protein [Paenibacillus sp. ACRRY]|uniref:ABC transporter substrate-binding protein n=1 Tax=Paenibacillus sp. ACRRY TaxID=2918208 RepID=UPI001EF41461|nr:extracellular solute-binding protein [Paenibacillus sp. ACRRY]MCG7384667.1 extracellular solute-binding protein [Paenibacillus sp. ACRRY]
MKKNVVKALSLLTSILLIVVITACGNENSSNSGSDSSSDDSATGGKVSITLMEKYSDPVEKLPLDYALAELKEEFPNVEVRIEPMPRDSGQKLKVLAASGNLPDIFHLEGAQAEVFYKSGSLLQLDEYVADTELESKMKPQAFESLKGTDGHIYYLRTENSDNGLLFINKDLFAQNNVKIPGNYDELLEAVKVFHSKDILPMAIFAKEKWPGLTFFDMFLSREVPTGYKALVDGSISANDPLVLKAAQKELELVNSGLISKSAFTTSYDDAFALFSSGKAAMLPNGSWVTKDMYDKMGDSVDFLLPSVFADGEKAETTKVNAVGGGGSYVGIGVSANTKNKEVTAKFAAALALKLNEGFTVKNGAPTTILKENPVYEGTLDPLSQKKNDYVETIETMSIFDWEFTDIKVKTAVGDATEKLLGGFVTVEEFIKQLEKAVETK